MGEGMNIGPNDRPVKANKQPNEPLNGFEQNDILKGHQIRTVPGKTAQLPTEGAHQFLSRLVKNVKTILAQANATFENGARKIFLNRSDNVD